MNECVGCKNYDPKRHYCFRFLCGAEKVKRCETRGDLEMKEVNQRDMDYWMPKKSALPEPSKVECTEQEEDE